ncbi:MAG: hemerythrin family protein [Gammaproteobacteria bacterium]|nr:hemerythrin family protein [Gammaproteobacteria bacterium]
MAKTNIGQKISFAIAILFYISGVGCGIMAFYTGQDGLPNDPIVAAYGASVVFFFGAGFVLHVIGKANLPDLRVKK